MTKIPVLSGSEFIKKLKKLGFVATRQKESHVRLSKSLKDGTIKISVPLHKELKKGILSGLIKDAGLTVEGFVSLK